MKNDIKELTRIIHERCAANKIGPEIVSWLVGEGRKEFIECTLRPLCEKYNRYKINNEIREATMEIQSGTYLTEVDYSVSLNDLCDLGIFRHDMGMHEYDLFLAKFTPNITGKSIVNIEFLFFELSRPIYAHDAIDMIFKRGYRPAELREMLAFDIKFPHIKNISKRSIPILNPLWNKIRGGDYSYVCLAENLHSSKKIRGNYYGELTLYPIPVVKIK